MVVCIPRFLKRSNYFPRPFYRTKYSSNIFQDSHPDLLFGSPTNYNRFFGELERRLRKNYGTTTRISPVTLQIGIGEIQLRNVLYIDKHNRDLMAFDAFRLHHDEITILARTINKITNNRVYVLSDPHPEFSKLLKTYHPFLARNAFHKFHKMNITRPDNNL